MPVYLRNLFIKLTIKKQEEERKEIDRSRGVSEGTLVSKKDAAKVPGFLAKQVSAK